LGRGRAKSSRFPPASVSEYVKGAVSHVDHKTIVLQVWHRVMMNTEGQSQAMRHIVFLD
jgi:hypothetical protein